jgi:hypothetical protein
MKAIFVFMQEHLGKFYVPICVHEVCVSFCDVFLTSFSDHEVFGFFKKDLKKICTKLLMAIWPSSLYMFPKSISSSCKVHLAIMLFGYFAKLTLPSCQVHILLYQSFYPKLNCLWFFLKKFMG